MKKLFTALILVLMSATVKAHDMTPTYPVLRDSYLEGLLVTEMEIFNKRNDVEYYEIAVFDKDMKPIPFVTSYKVFKLEYLKKIKLEIYIRKNDEQRALYVCSRSRSLEKNISSTNISSMICSKFRKKAP